MEVSPRRRHLRVSNDTDGDHDEPSPKTDAESASETPKSGSRRNVFATSLRGRTLGQARGSVTSKGETGSRRLLTATSAILERLKEKTLRSGSGGRDLNPRSVTLVTSFHPPSRRSTGAKNAPAHSPRQDSPITGVRTEGNEESSSSETSERGEGRASPPVDVREDSNDLSAIFDDDGEFDDLQASKASSIASSDDQEYATSPRSKWAATLMASTLAREKATGNTTVRGRVDLLPRLADAGNKVEYLIKVCKAAQAYASTQAPKLSKVRDGQHMINQLRDVTSDLGRQHDKILAVYEAREVRRSADRLGETLNGVYDLLGDVEDVAVMFGRKKGFGKRVSALVHDIGTHANSLLAATSLAIADRPSVLYMTDTGEGGPPVPQQEELLKMCIEGDKYFFGRGEKPNPKKAFEAYSWAAERGCAEAMYMMACMYMAGGHMESDEEKSQLWLERAVEKGYAPALNNLAVILLGEADRLEEAHPDVKASASFSSRDSPSISADGGEPQKEGRKAARSWESGDIEETNVKIQEEKCADKEEVNDEEEETEGGTSLLPEQVRLFEKIMGKRKRSMRLLQEAAKTGHTDAMTNLGNMQEAMGYFDDARNSYSLAAGPSESANNSRAQNYLGTLFYAGRGVTRDLAEAVKWFRRGARQGNAQACYNLGTCYQAGLGVAKDMPKAVELFRQAVEGGSISATNNLAYVLARDALHTLAAAARQAPMCISGTGLKFKDPSRRAMHAGDVSSEASTQVWCESTAQLREAADLFRRAADNGISDASYQLGRLYQQGLGIPRDPVAAFENFLAAANSSEGHPTAAARVGDMLYAGTGCLQDHGEALRYYIRAANAEDSASANAAGLMHELGRGVVRDLTAAGEWYARAADLGSADGAFNAALLLERGDPVSAIASAAGLLIPEPRQGASSSRSSHLPLRRSTPPSRATRQGTRATATASRAAGNAENEQALPRRRHDDGEQPRGDGGEGETSVDCHPRGRHGGNDSDEGRNISKERLEVTESARQQQRRQVWGDRLQALRMFERAAELGHPGAGREVHRLRLRERMDSLVAKQPASLRSSNPGARGGHCSPSGGGGRGDRV